MALNLEGLSAICRPEKNAAVECRVIRGGDRLDLADGYGAIWHLGRGTREDIFNAESMIAWNPDAGRCMKRRSAN
jgi:hypothetical protein